MAQLKSVRESSQRQKGVRQQRIIDASGLSLWTETFGEPANPCLLLSMAAYWQGIAWPVEFCERLAQRGYFVVRYDHRDTGRSTLLDYDRTPYSLVEMADDVLRILDAYQVGRAHLLGGSMGGMIIQEFALRYPSRVLSMIIMMSTPLSHSYASGTPPVELPGPTETAWKAFATVPGPGVQPTREQYVEGWTAFSRGVAGSIAPFDAQQARDLHGESFDRARDVGAVWNHLKATQATPDRLERLGSLNVPTLVVHGSEDHVIPVSHGHALADCVPGAELSVIEGLGHQFDQAALTPVAETVLDYLAPGS